MAKRSDFAQKLLDDLRQRKQQMGLAQGSHQRTDRLKSDAYGSSKGSFQGSGESSAKRLINKKTTSIDVTQKISSNRNQRALAPGTASQEIVPFGRARRTENKMDLSMAIELAFGKTGAHINMELSRSGRENGRFILQKGSLDFRDKQGKRVTDGQWLLTNKLPHLSQLQIAEISKGTQQLNMILKACSGGISFDNNSLEIGRKLLKGALDLEESLRMLVSLQEASDNMVRPERKKVRLLNEKDEDEQSDQEAERSMILSAPRFSFDRISRFQLKDTREVIKANTFEKKKANSSRATKLDLPRANSNRNSSSDTKQFAHRHSASSAPTSKPDSPSLGKGNQNFLSRDFHNFSDSNSAMWSESTEKFSVTIQRPPKMKQQGPPVSSERQKARIPNVIAKLMGLEELPPSKPEPSKGEVKTISKPKQEAGAETTSKANIQRRKEAEIASSEKYSLQLKEKLHRNEKIAVPVPLSLIPSKIKGIENTNQKLEDSQKQNIGGQMTPSDRNQEKEAAQEYEAVGRKGSYSWKEKGKAEQISKDVLKSLPETGPRRSPRKIRGQVDGEARIYESTRKKRSPPLKDYGNANKGLVLPHHQLNPSENNESQNTYQKLESEIPMDRALARKENNGLKSTGTKKVIPLLHYSKTSTNERSSQKLLTQKSSIVYSKKNSTDFMDKMQIKEFTKEQNINLNTISRSTICLDVHGDSLSKNLKQQITLRTDENTDGQKIISLFQSTGSMRPSQLDVAKLESTTCSPVAAIQNLTKMEENAKTSIQEHQTSVLHELKQRKDEEIHKSDERDLSPHVLILENHLQEEPKLTAIECVTDDFIMAKEEDPKIEGDTKLVFPECRIDGMPIENSVRQESRAKSPEESPEPPYYDLKESQTKEITGDTHISNYDNLRQKNQSTSEFDNKWPISDDEKHLRQILVSNHHFLNTTQALFHLEIPIDLIESSKNICHDQETKLILDCGYEVMRRKGKREDLMLHTKLPTKPGKARSVDNLIKELNSDLKSLKFSQATEDHEHDTAECLHKMIKRDVESKKPDISCMWDLGWNAQMFARIEMDEVAKDMERHILNTLITEMVVEIF